MRTATTRTQKYSANPSPTLYLAFELGWNTWTLGFSVGFGQPPRIRRIDARDLGYAGYLSHPSYFWPK
jgi:hypothetical protein